MIRNLDFLRALAVLLVFGGHLFLYNHVQPGIIFVIAARVGVILFFIHTSYVLMLSLDRLVLHHKNFRKVAISFYIRRVFRIYPLAIFVITIVTILGAPYMYLPAAEEKGVAFVATYLANLFLVQNLALRPDTYGVLWTLPIELQLYLFLPLFFLLAKRGIEATTILGILSLGVGVLAYLAQSSILSFAVYLPCFAFGTIAYTLTIHRDDLKKFSGVFWPIVLLLIIIAVVLIGSNLNTESGYYIAYNWAVSLSVALLVPLFKDMKKSWLSGISFQIAKYSYGIYLFHLPIMAFTNNNWLGTIILTTIASVVAYYVIELPLISVGKRLTMKESSKTEAFLSVPAP